MTKPARSRRSILINAVLVIVAFTLLGLSIWKNQGEIKKVLRGPLNGWLFLAAFVVYFTGIVLTFVRWYVLVRALDIPFRLKDALRLGFIGNIFNLVIPGAVGGDLVKAYYLCQEQARKAQAVASMVIDRILGLVGLFLLAGITGLWVWPSAPAQVQRLIVVVWVTVAAGLIGLLVLFTPALYRPLARLAAGRGKLEAILAELVATASAYRARVWVVGLMLVFATCIHSLYVFAFYLLSMAMFPRLPSLGQHFVIVPLILFTTAVPLPFGALGLSEHVSDQLFKLVNYPGGAVAMMGFRVLMYAGGVVSAIVYLINIQQVRSLAELSENEDGAAGTKALETSTERAS